MMEIQSVSPSFWQNKSVLITGHTGFKGSWLSLWLTQLGAKVAGFALPPPTQPNLFTLASVAKGVSHHLGDIRNYADMLAVVKHHQPEIVFHMAAQPLVLSSYKDPIETYETNVMGTVNLLEALRQVGCAKAIINVTTDKCYENKEWNWGYRESDRLGGHDPYSSSKACSELVTAAYRRSFFKEANVGLASARAGNVIGGGDWAQNRLIPDIIHACMNNQAVLVRHPEAMRPWQHVLEPLRGYLLIGQHLYIDPSRYDEPWNFGPEDEDTKPVQWIVNYIVNKWGNNIPWKTDQIKTPHEAAYLKLDCSYARAKLGFRPTWNLQQGLDKTIEWYRAYLAKDNIQELTLTQIKRYAELALARNN